MTTPLSPRRKRKAPNMHEKLASALLHIRRGIGDDWLVKGELRNASAKEICAAMDWDHIRRWAEGGSNHPQNLQPLPRAEHRAKSRKDTTEVAKGKRFGAAQEQFQRRLLAKAGLAEPVAKPKRKAKIQSRNTLTKQARAEMKAWKEKQCT